MGIFQIGFGALRLGEFIRPVPETMIFGFVNGLAIVIFLAQFGQLRVGIGSPYLHEGPCLKLRQGSQMSIDAQSKLTEK